MSLAEQVALWMSAGLTLYAILGGADLGGGVWDLLSSGPRSAEQRKAVSHAMGPVWEANHVWLLFCFIILFTAFPVVFQTLSIALFAPLNVVLAAIVFRGAAFAFRHPLAADVQGYRQWSCVFGVSSVVVLLGLGAALGAISTGGIRFTDGHISAVPTASWLSPSALGLGLLTLVSCSFLTAVFMTMETTGELRLDFQRRAVYALLAQALVVVAMLPLLAYTAPALWNRLVAGYARYPAFLAGLMMVAAFVLLQRQQFSWARAAAVLQNSAMLWSILAAQWPYLIFPDLTLANAASPAPTLRFILLALPLGMLVLVPSLLFLFYTFKRPALLTEQ